MKTKLSLSIVCAGLLLASLTTIGVPLASADAPTEPSQPYPADGSNGVTVFITIHWLGDGPGITYDVFFGNINPPPLVVSNQTATTYDPGVLQKNTTYYWQIIAYNTEQQSTSGPIWSFTTTEDQPPYQPQVIEGPTAAGPGIQLTFTAVAPDPEGDEVHYQWDWGDGNFSDWLGPYAFGAHAAAEYHWAANGTYDVRVRAKDGDGKISEWSMAYQVSIAWQLQLRNLRPGYLYLNFFGFDQGFAYIYALDFYDIALMISTDGFTVNASASEEVALVVFQMMNLLYNEEVVTSNDDDFSDGCTGYFAVSPGLYQLSALAYDADGHLIDRAVSQYVVYYQWKFILIKALWNRIKGI
ncbi:MAG: PKD domain-containing protein [Candidatus Thermoplasmatota archaeon]|nr:PKD domain-containing protein [Candidatus Thermoplasmatota archaeon]